MNGHILLVDDNEKLSETLISSVSYRGYVIDYASNIKDAKNFLIHNPVDVVLLDIRLGNENGMDFLEYCTASNHPVSVIMITGYGTIELAIESMRKGAFDFIQKPIKVPKLLEVIERALKRRKLSDATVMSENETVFLTKNPVMLELMEKIKVISNTELPILICGETGVGKDLIAEYIHKYSGHKAKILSKINCAALADNLLDNELFGHEKGAYTGAEKQYKGLFEQADGSTVFLDELGDMSMSIQAKILRTIQNNEIRRLGGSGVVKVKVRFIAATNKNLEKMMSEHKFRRDLYYRLSAGSFT
ncbi:MAG: sigma-54-dependent Fis family transcriptional regulator, partial [Spirochaetaceae bacterium]|nr:sigma-54-dependent Fis family transcriptional regulator [Spirochaetaceae bacterium]